MPWSVVTHVVAPLPRVAAHARDAWTAVAPRDLPRWNARLLETGASLFQYPYWNEPLRVLHMAPQYLVHGPAAAPRAYACVLRLGPPGLRIGLVQRGPVQLLGGPDDRRAAVHDLARWARAGGYAFLRVTHEDADVLDDVATAGRVEATNAFPFYREPPEELVVEQEADDEAVQRRFQPIARRNLRRAAEVGYRLESSDAPDALADVWPLFEGLSRRKRLSFRPRASFREMLALARPHDAARVYVAYLAERPVQALIVVRDRDVAHYVAGALDTPALGERASPSVLLHWFAMRDAFRRWGTHYDLGTRSGNVYPFKRKFRPTERRHPPPSTLVTGPARYALWTRAALPLVTSHWPRIKAMLAGRGGAPAGEPEETTGEPASGAVDAAHDALDASAGSLPR